MSLKDSLSKAKATAEEIGDSAQGKVYELLDEYKKASASLETFGYTIGKFTVGMGLLPEIHTSITGSIDNIHEDKIETMIAERSGEKLLTSLLKALLMAKKFSEYVDLRLSNVTLYLTLGVPPKIRVEMG